MPHHLFLISPSIVSLDIFYSFSLCHLSVFFYIFPFVGSLYSFGHILKLAYTSFQESIVKYSETLWTIFKTSLFWKWLWWEHLELANCTNQRLFFRKAVLLEHRWLHSTQFLQMYHPVPQLALQLCLICLIIHLLSNLL